MSHASRHPRRIVLAAAALLLLCGAAGAQTKESDPRQTEDPRKVVDPRKTVDPRDTTPDPFAGLQGAELCDALYKAGEIGRLRQLFHDTGWQILGYIDSHCEGWLALYERKTTDTEEGRKQADEMQAKGRALASLADSALENTRFSNYVNNFYGWDPDQQATFREGQKLYRQAVTLVGDAKTPQEALQALTPLQQSLSRARELGDTWGQSMALSLMGRIQADNQQFSDSGTTLNEAVRIGREIRDIESVWNGLALLYETALTQRLYEPAHEALQEQYLVSQEVNDKETAEKVLKQLLELDKAFDRD